MTINEVGKRIKVKSGTYVEIHVKRESRTHIFQIRRQKIEIPFVEEEKLDTKTYYIGLRLFAFGIDKQFRTAMENFDRSGASKLIIDVRDNPG